VVAPDPSPARLRLQVSAIRPLAAGCKLFELKSPHGGPLPAADAGAHIGLHLANGLERFYSLLDPEPAPTRYRIGVKRDPDSRGGSAYLYEKVRLGDVIEVEPPRNNFPLNETAAETVLIAGGIGITPIWAMIQRLQRLNRRWSLFYAARSRSEAAFARDVVAFPNAHLHLDEEAGGLLDVAAIVRKAPRNTHFYCCGPTPMLKVFEAAVAAAGVPAECIHVEYFAAKYEAAREGSFVLELAKSGKEVRVPPGTSILAAVRAAGIETPSSCEEGVCGACETKVLSGRPDHRDAILSPREREESRSMFICCSGSLSERLVLDL
jgi:tetrachlorobenzoquinone reductase